MLSAGFAPLTRKALPGSPIRSIAPSKTLKGESPVSNSANLMLDEPPLTDRMQELTDRTNVPFVILQSKRGQFRARGHKIGMKNASDSQLLRDLREHRRVLDIYD